MESLRVKFDDPAKKEQFIEYLRRQEDQLANRIAKYKWIPVGMESVPVVGVGLLGLKAWRSGKLNQATAPLALAAAIATAPASQVMRDIGNRIAARLEARDVAAFKKKMLRKAKEMGADIEVPSGLVKVR
ncbi:MAG: hypothetical protein GXO39_09280 [Thermotogae bacterium]|nr:hypothetical protein [Thermotogota bacterium]